MFDSREEERLGLTERRYKTLSVLLAHDFSLDALPEKVMIYEEGIIRKELYRKRKDITAVECFIDRQIVLPDDAPYGQDRKILIMACMILRIPNKSHCGDFKEKRFFAGCLLGLRGKQKKGAVALTNENS